MENRLRASVNKTAAAGFIAPAGAYLTVAIALVAFIVRSQSAATVAVGAPPVTVPAAAVGLLFAAAALLLQSRAGAATRAIRRFAAAAALMVGLITLAYYLTGSGAGPRLPWWAQPPGPMMGLGLVFISLSLLFIDTRHRWAMLGATATLVVALMGLVGHAYGAGLLYGLNRWGGTAVSTGVALAALALGVLFADPSRGIAAVSLSSSSGGQLLRRMLPVALLAPLILGWLTLAAQNADLVDAAYGTALLVVSLIVLGGGSASAAAPRGTDWPQYLGRIPRGSRRDFPA